ncbi:M55 family metallopeptidase [Desulfoplanes sp.]
MRAFLLCFHCAAYPFPPCPWGQTETTRFFSPTLCRLRPPLTITDPVSMQVSLTTTSGADRILRMPATRRKDGRTVTWEGKSILEAYRAFLIMSDLMDLIHFI